MKKLIQILLLMVSMVPLLSACTPTPFVFKNNMQQGNVIDYSNVVNLRKGMTHEEVADLLGTPLIVDSFGGNYWQYTYRFAKENTYVYTDTLKLYFDEDGKLDKLNGNYADKHNISI